MATTFSRSKKAFMCCVLAIILAVVCFIIGAMLGVWSTPHLASKIDLIDDHYNEIRPREPETPAPPPDIPLTARNVCRIFEDRESFDLKPMAATKENKNGTTIVKYTQAHITNYQEATLMDAIKNDYEIQFVNSCISYMPLNKFEQPILITKMVNSKFRADVPAHTEFTDLTQVIFEGKDQSHDSPKSQLLNQSVFKGTMNNVTLSYVDVNEAIFKGAMNNVTLKDVDAKKVEFEGAMNNVTLSYVDADDAIFKSEMNNVTLEDVDAKRADFNPPLLESASEKPTYMHKTIKQLNIEDSNIEGAHFKGIIFDSSEIDETNARRVKWPDGDYGTLKIYCTDTTSVKDPIIDHDVVYGAPIRRVLEDIESKEQCKMKREP